MSQKLPLPLNAHEKYSHSANNISPIVSLISLGDEGNVTVSLPSLNNSEELEPLELWLAQRTPTSIQVSILNSINILYPKI